MKRNDSSALDFRAHNRNYTIWMKQIKKKLKNKLGDCSCMLCKTDLCSFFFLQEGKKKHSKNLDYRFVYNASRHNASRNNASRSNASRYNLSRYHGGYHCVVHCESVQREQVQLRLYNSNRVNVSRCKVSRYSWVGTMWVGIT